MDPSVKEALQELEYLRADIDLLRQEVDSMNQYMKLQSRSVSTMVTTLRDIIKEQQVTLHTVPDGDIL